MIEIFDIWGNTEGYVSLPRKRLTSQDYGSKNNKGVWEEHSFPWHNNESERVEILEWINTSITEGYNIYWCPTVLNSRRRVKESIPQVSCLYADLDEMPLSNLKTFGLQPTLLWETSKGRHSAVWKLASSFDADVAEMVNKYITYSIGADTGGWDLSQVLRVPGSKNFKYKDQFVGKVIRYTKSTITSIQIQPILIKALKELQSQKEEEHEDYIENPLDLNEILSAYDNIPEALIQLINCSEEYVLTQDRSKQLWRIESELHKCNITRDDAISIVLKSNWNKYKGRKDEYKRVILEIDKIYSSALPRITVTGEERPPMTLQSYSQFMSEDLAQPEWLVQDWWQLESHGMISGEPKTYKSTLITDMMVSVASGVPFLNKFPVNKTGPVIYIQEENAPVLVKDRVLKVASSRNLLGKIETKGKHLEIEFPQILPIHFMNNQGFDLTSNESRNFLKSVADTIKPSLVVFDPLYLMLGDKDENSSKDVRDVLRWLVGFRYDYNSGVILLHHWNKNGKTERGGQRMLGSTLFHAWVESAIYCSVSNEQLQEITVERELRSFHKPDKVVIKFIMGEPGDLTYDVKIIGEISTKSEAILNLLAQYDSLDNKFLAQSLSCKVEEITNEIVKLNKEGKIESFQKDGEIRHRIKKEKANEQ